MTAVAVVGPGALGLGHLPRRGPEAVPTITGLAVDSRVAGAGDLFFALPGTKLDGAAFAQYAVRKGAVAVVATPEGADRLAADLGALPVPVFVTDRPREALARAAAAFWPGQPATMVAVTGTNGKTSCVHFLRQIWAAAGARAVSIGTTGVEGEGLDEPLSVTTPEPITLHRLLDRLAAKGCTHAAMEASSHALAQARVDGVRLAAGGLTNITRDHMDYHPTHDDYVAAKMRLFDTVLPGGAAAVVNAHDPVAPRVAEIAARRGLRLLTVGHGAGHALRIAGQEMEPDGQSIRLVWDRGEHRVRVALIGAFQAENLAIAAALALATGTAPEAVWAALPTLRGVRGRMERVATRANGAQVVVDYAHTPDALATALRALRPHVAGRLIAVAGAGGDRDRGKRPLMGRAMAEHADLAIVTDDNPRSEDPARIRAEVMAGCPEAEEIGDRAEAILAGVDALGPGDALLIAGKGHETGQEIDGRVHPFDDAEQARAAVAALDGDGA